MSGDDAHEGRAASESFFDRLYADHRREIHAFLRGRAGDAETALDLLQETYLRVWRHLPKLREMPPQERRSWIFAVARNLITDDYRKSGARNAAAEEILRSPRLVVSRSENPQEKTERSEQLKALEDAIGRLPENLRVPLVMQALGEMTSERISETLGIPAGTVRYRISEARKRLAKDLRKFDALTAPEESRR
jgi:RNA polymerase sigma-70 factor (ECF subfamily)